MNYTPEQLREQAIDAAWCLPDSGRYAEECRAHADKIEECGRYKAEVAKLKGHAEAMALYLAPKGERCGCECTVCTILNAYRRDYPKEGT